MARSVAYRRTVSDLVSWRQDQALNATIFILRETGPTGYLLQEEGVSKKFKVFLGERHTCTCSDFRKDNDLCKHVCWILLRKFRIPRNDPLSWQGGFVQRELDDLIYGGFHARQEAAKKTAASHRPPGRRAKAEAEAAEAAEAEEGRVVQRPVAEEDVCPICQAELLESRLPVTFCKFSCGNSVHLRCMRVYWEHERRKDGSGAERLKQEVVCPICRGNFGPASLLMREVNGARFPAQATGHPGTECSECSVQRIQGKCYKCDVCSSYTLCQKCFNTPVHQQHSFSFRERPHQSWRPAERTAAGFPNALVNALQSRDITDEDYDMLLQLDSSAEGSALREADIKALPSWRVRQGSRHMAPGQQCRLCLMVYRVGQLLRRLPACGHTFHAACADPWLLHRRAACPLDGRAVVPVSPDRSGPASGPASAPTEAEAAAPSLLALAGQSCHSAGAMRGASGPPRGPGSKPAPVRRLPPLPPRGAAAAIPRPFTMAPMGVTVARAPTPTRESRPSGTRHTSLRRPRSNSNSRRRSLPEPSETRVNALDLCVTGISNANS